MYTGVYRGCTSSPPAATRALSRQECRRSPSPSRPADPGRNAASASPRATCHRPDQRHSDQGSKSAPSARPAPAPGATPPPNTPTRAVDEITGPGFGPALPSSGNGLCGPPNRKPAENRSRPAPPERLVYPWPIAAGGREACGVRGAGSRFGRNGVRQRQQAARTLPQSGTGARFVRSTHHRALQSRGDFSNPGLS